VMAERSARSGSVGLPEPSNRISRAAIWYWTVRNLVALAIAATALIVPQILLSGSGTAASLTFGVTIGVLVLTLIGCVAVPLWRYAVHRWETTDSLVLTRSGAVFRDWRIVPLDRVQTVEVSQGILERAFGVAKVEIRTASYAGSTDIAGLRLTLAREVAGQLTRSLTRSADDGA
jgi:membrane protein YdbS with pleckstrin-like domain